MERYAVLGARLLLAHMFLIAGISKIGNYSGTRAYMEAMGVPGSVEPLVILLEIGGALALILGYQARLAAVALGVFSLAAAAIFHTHWGDQTQMIMFMKNVTIAGGMLMLAVHGAGDLSLDARLGRPRPGVGGGGGIGSHAQAQ